MKTVIFLFISIFYISVPINARKTVDEGFVDVLEVVNKDLVLILDSIVEHEKRCDYYDPGLIFGIRFYGDIVSIESVGNRINKSDAILGCFFLKKHLFFVKGRQLFNSLIVKTTQKMQYNFAVPKSGIDPKGRIYCLTQDDSYSQWLYIYKNNELILLNTHTFCK